MVALLGGWLLLALSQAAVPPRTADSRPIRLRNETIEPLASPSSVVQRLFAGPEPRRRGLYLIQFTNRFDGSWRDVLAARGVELIRYVPDDTFLVSLTGVRLTELTDLPFVHWVGPFEARHKVHPSVTRKLATMIPGTALEIKVLVSPDAKPVEVVALTRSFTQVKHYRSPQLGIVLTGKIHPSRLGRLIRSQSVLWIENAPKMTLFDEVATKIVAGDPDSAGSLGTVHALGFDGRDVIVAVADSGLDSGDVTFMHPDLEGRVEALFAYDGLVDASDEHSHGTHCAGIVAGNAGSQEKDESGYYWGLGVAPGARIVGQRIFDGGGEYRPPPSYARLTQDAVRSGAYIGSNSWGDDTHGQYDISAAEFDALVRDADPDLPGEQAYVLEFSAGNSGPGGQTIGSPAVGKNVIATGATQNNRFEFPIYGDGQEVMADFSSRGPCEDGRIKPDITAPGTWIASLRSIFADDNNAWGPISDLYLYQGGTSQAGPHASGACAIFVQWYRQMHSGRTPSPALVKAALINSADDMATAEIPDNGGIGGGFGEGESDGTIVVGDTGAIPNNDEGWGRINLENLIDSDRRYSLVDQGDELRTGQIYEQKIIIGPDDSLKVTLVYTDVPGLPAAIPALVNDLDLEVISPDGLLFRGNAFSDGESTPGTPVGDRINNVEAVHLASPAAGQWTVRVRGVNVVQDVHRRISGPFEQDFALVVSGQLPLPGEGVVSWDRDGYRVPAAATLRLVDAELAPLASVSVQVSSGRESTPFEVLLNRGVDSGTFVGSVQLSTNPPVANDGLLSVADGDEIVVTYTDANPAGVRRATAAIDSQPPAVSGVQATSEFGRAVIRWVTGEPGTSTVVFGISNAVTQVISVPGYGHQHRVLLPELITGETYYYFVVSADRAGNTTTNTLDGTYYRFVAPRSSSALLVYSPESLFAEGGLLSDTPYPGIETWTSALDALSIDYEVWDVSEQGRTPLLDELKSYRAVLWRPEELVGPSPGFLTAVAGYVQSGGSLFVASFDLPTRLREINQTNFLSSVLHVESAQEDGGAVTISGVPGDPVGGGVTIGLNFGDFPSGLVIELIGIVWESGPDFLTVGTNSAPVFVQESGKAVGLRYPRTGVDSSGRVVYLSVALESIPFFEEAPNNRPTVLGNALRFLSPELAGGSSVTFDSSAYTVPASVVVEVADSQRLRETSVTVAITNGTKPLLLELPRTPKAGLFRGRFVLDITNSPATTQPRLPATHGDVFRATYLDSTQNPMAAEARVDTFPPKISGVEFDPAYSEAVITWTTDKPTDALVRFGESRGDDSFLTKSAYSSEFGTSHELVMTGLAPDRRYFFQVVSRDAAGNVTVDSRGGKFYTFRTLTPLPTPWRDTLERGTAGWAVYNDDGGTGAIIGDDDDGGGEFAAQGWQHGKPLNQQSVTAHSGENVWATNLEGQPVDFAITDLISPVINLVGGNRATLRFMQNYRFGSGAGGGGDEDDPFGDFVLEAGQVALTTDNGLTWKDLYVVDQEVSDGWEEVEVDISRYVGNVIRLRFNYQLFAFNTTDRLGWLLDDVSIEMNSVAASSVVVENNMSQAHFKIAGAPGGIVDGVGVLFRTNLPPATYVITWLEVPYYITPSPQTNTLAANLEVVFRGSYGFPDANQNGVSDLWEQQVLGGLIPANEAQRDTDGDGALDAVEFMHGTDPKDRASVLRLVGPIAQSNRTVRFEWPTTVGRTYRLEVSNDLEQWVSAGEPLRGAGNTQGVNLSALDPRLNYFFRVLVVP